MSVVVGMAMRSLQVIGFSSVFADLWTSDVELNGSLCCVGVAFGQLCPVDGTTMLL